MRQVAWRASELCKDPVLTLKTHQEDICAILCPTFICSSVPVAKTALSRSSVLIDVLQGRDEIGHPGKLSKNWNVSCAGWFCQLSCNLLPSADQGVVLHPGNLFKNGKIFIVRVFLGMGCDARQAPMLPMCVFPSTILESQTRCWSTCPPTICIPCVCRKLHTNWYKSICESIHEWGMLIPPLFIIPSLCSTKWMSPGHSRKAVFILRCWVAWRFPIILFKKFCLAYTAL